MSYAVVCFLEESKGQSEVVQEVPLTWLRDNNEICLWPPTNTTYHITNGTLPMATWKRCRVRCDKICDTLKEARSRCYNVVSSEEEKGRGQRKKFLSKHLIGHKAQCPSPPLPTEDCYDEDYHLQEIGQVKHPEDMCLKPSIGYQSEETLDQTHPNNSLDKCKQQFSQQNYLVGQAHEQFSQRNNSLLQSHQQLSQQNFTLHQAHEPFSQQSNQSEAIPLETQDNRLIIIENKLDKIMIMLGNIMVEVEAARSKFAPVSYKHKQKFPFTTIEEILDFNKVVESDPQNKIELTKYFLSIGGLNAKDFHSRAMAKTMTNSLAMTCSWKGLKNNHRIGHFQIWSCLYDAISQVYSITLKEFEIFTKDWLRHAKQRRIREEASH